MNYTKKCLRISLLILIAFMLVFSTSLPSVAMAAVETIAVDLTPGLITEEGTQSNGIQLELKLSDSDREWATDIISKKDLLIDSMTATINPIAWDTYKSSVKSASTVAIDSSNKILNLVLPNSSAYEISKDETINMNLSPTLIENWSGEVTELSFTIYAEPQISIGGSVVPSVTAKELKLGKATIELSLVNATWVKEQFNTITNLQEFPGQFDEPSIANSVNFSNPNDVIEFLDDQKTLLIKLLAMESQKNVVNFSFNPTLSTKYAKIKTVGGVSVGTNITHVAPMKFDIDQVQTEASLTFKPSAQIKEADIELGTSFTLSLAGAKWDTTLTDAKKEALIEVFIAKNQPEQWEKVKNKLTNTDIERVSETEIKINIPKVEGYELIADQKITIAVPTQLLQNAVELAPVDFIIKATPKALIKGSVTEGVSQADIIKGGETIIVELVNSKWDEYIARNTQKREVLLSGFKWGDATQPADIADIIKAKANVVRTNDEVVTITLPPIPGFKIDENFNSQVVLYTHPSDPTITVQSVYNSFTITAVTNQSATISGSILTNTNEFDIVSGGKVIMITLKNDIWAKDVSSLINKFILNDAKGSTSVSKGGTTPNIIGTVKRTSDTVVTIELDKNNNFSLNADATAKLNIPAELLSVSSKGIEVTSAFKIAAVTAELPNKADLTIDKADIQKGSKTITLTLKNAVFAAHLTANTVIKGLKSANTPGWVSILDELDNDKNKKNIIISKDKLTIKLPPVPTYNSNVGETINLQVPYEWIKESPQIPTGQKLEVSGNVLLGAVATTTLFTPSINESDIKKIGGKFKIEIMLNGTKWDPTITSNKSKQSTLAKGFTTKDQTKEWALITKAMASLTTTYSLNGDKLTIEFATVPDYSIIRDQEVDIKISKFVLLDYKTDIEVNGKLMITVLTATASDKSLSDLTAAELLDAMMKNVETILVNTVELPSAEKIKPSITTIEVTTNDDVKTVDISIAGQTQENVTQQGNKFTVIYKNLPKNSEMKVSVFGADHTKPLQADIYKKIGKGRKLYEEIPKKDYTGSYLIYDLLTDKTLLKDILKYYSIDELKVTK